MKHQDKRTERSKKNKNRNNHKGVEGRPYSPKSKARGSDLEYDPNLMKKRQQKGTLAFFASLVIIISAGILLALVS